MPKKIPLRQCVGCREMKPKKEPIRVVKSPEGEVSLDFTGKQPGRRAYVCPAAACLRRARKPRALERALSRPEELMREIRAYTMHHEPHRDCRRSARVLDAVDDYIARGHAGLKSKPLNPLRKWTHRRQMRHSPPLEIVRRGL
mgnify:CR=1 FL=1